MKYSDPLRRIAAFLIDCIVLIAIYATLGFTLGVSQIARLLTIVPMIGFWFYGGMFAIAWFYFAFCESSSWQATVGKKLLGLQVVDLQGKKVSFWRATARHFSKFFSRLLLMIGFLMVLWTKKRQGLHDKMASTLVIKTHS